jgi:acylphosphatase
MTEYRIKIEGMVQGVGYRAFAQKEAAALGIRGIVRNMADGGVEVVAQGDPEALQELMAKLRLGPPAAHVLSVEFDKQAVHGSYRSFEVGSSEY